MNQFSEITNYDKETESSKVLRLLTVCNWNLEAAIARYFDNDFPQLFDESELGSLVGDEPRRTMPLPSRVHLGSPPPSVTDSGSEPGWHSLPNSPTPTDLPRGATPEDIQDMINQFANATPPIPTGNNFMIPLANEYFLPKLQRAFPISNKWKFQAGLLDQSSNTKYSKLLTPIVFLLLLMPRVLWFIGWGLNKLLGNFAPRLFRILGLREEEEDFPSAPFYNTIEDISNYDIETYIKRISGNDDPKLPIYKGEFNDAYEEARSNFKWFCVILLNSRSVSASETLIGDFLMSKMFIDFVRNNDIVLYVGDVSYPEPFEVGKSYGVFGVPYLSLIANVSVTGTTHPEFSVICKYNKLLNQFVGESNERSILKIFRRLNKIISRYEPQLITQRYDKQEAEFSRILREQQDNAYQESLLKDMERENEKKKKQNEQEELKAKLLKEEQEIQNQKTKRREAVIDYINRNYSKDMSGWQRGDFTTIQFRNENGQRYIRKFYKDETAFDIFMYILSRQLIDEIITDTTNQCENESEVLGYFKSYDFKFDLSEAEFHKITFSFDLVSPMPRLRLKPDQIEVRQIREIWPNGSLLIERKEYDDDAEEEGDEDYDDDDDDDDDEEESEASQKDSVGGA